MATVVLSTDGYFVTGTTNVNQDIPLLIPAGTAANTYTLPGTPSDGNPGETFPGYTLGVRFVAINQSSNTQTFAAPTGYTLVGTASIATGASTPTRVTYYLNPVTKQWIGF